MHTSVIEIVDMNIFHILNGRQLLVLTAPSAKRRGGMCSVHLWSDMVWNTFSEGSVEKSLLGKKMVHSLHE